MVHSRRRISKAERFFTSMLVLAAVLVTGVPRSLAVMDATTECLIGFAGVPDVDKDGGLITCTDCDPNCDTDGVALANKSCTFHLQACVNRAEGSCTGTALKRVKVKGKCAGTAALTFAPSGSGSACGPASGVIAKVKKNGTKPGKCKVVLMTLSADKPRRVDKDVLMLICNPRSGPCPTTTTTTSTSTSSTLRTTTTTVLGTSTTMPETTTSTGPVTTTSIGSTTTSTTISSTTTTISPMTTTSTETTTTTSTTLAGTTTTSTGPMTTTSSSETSTTILETTTTTAETTTTSTTIQQVVCEPIVTDGQGIPGTYNALGVAGPTICQTSSTTNVFGPCATDADCGGGTGNCAATPLVTADGTVLPFPTGISTTFTVAAEATPEAGCGHAACVQCGNPDGACPGIPGCGTTPGAPENGCVKNTCCDTPGLVLPTFFVPLIGGLCSRLDQYACGTGVVNTSNPQVGDNEVIKMADTSDPGPDCEYGTADDPAFKGCNTNTGEGHDTTGKIVRSVGDGTPDSNGIHYRLATPGLSTTWTDNQSPTGTCADGSTFEVLCIAGSRQNMRCSTDDTDPTTGCPGAACPGCCVAEVLVTQIILNAELSSAGATAGYMDMNGDGCALAGAGFTSANRAGPITVPSPPAAPQPYDGSAGSTAVAAGFALSGSGPLFDIGFVAVEPNGPVTRVTPTQTCTCTPVVACPE